MLSPFPGMNPYLEQFWSGVHHRLITAIANSVAPQIRPKYIVAVEERIYKTVGDSSVLVGIPDVSVHRLNTVKTPIDLSLLSASKQPITVLVPQTERLTESYLEIRRVGTEEVITAIEILSPINKKTGICRQQYEAKRQKILDSLTHFIEIDLWRQGKPMLVYGEEIVSDYRILISRSNSRPQADLYAFNLRDELPKIPLPLELKDSEPIINLREILQEIYEQGSYDLRIDYSREPVPPLTEEDAAWVDRQLCDRQLR
ncbi:DUF4058 family protein [Lyngbya sp. PCC 8106]|uniref:DUF4058 family protein n=1 Tax=Lyngbya sp. (strain PCC 8106) TaxID=313612 RepID=UPI0000EA9A52|nr:DUF4058 family protein [Lyngbya sp. PCC 8106]EAW34072.1 hypothetical protein L8106_25690 [Lyngbya sp. PCC 8106]